MAAELGSDVSGMNVEEVRQAAHLLKRAMWKGEEIQRLLVDVGIQVVPANFYSIVPSPTDFDNSFEFNGEVPYLDPGVFDDEAMVTYLQEALLPYSEEFDPAFEQPDEEGVYYWRNPAFSFSDAMAYYCVLRERKPQTVIEVGSGYSTLVAQAALARNGHGKLICVEPYPMDWLRDRDGIELHQTAVQELTSDWFNDRMDSGDVLFIDSTHTVKTGSDCAHLYLRVLPRLQGDLLIHAHDIYVPFAMPRNKAQPRHIYWNEGYVLLALLLENPRMRVVYGSTYHHELHPDLLRTFMHDRHPPGGASIWFERSGA